jgi:hypothetical protein
MKESTGPTANRKSNNAMPDSAAPAQSNDRRVSLAAPWALVGQEKSRDDDGDDPNGNVLM